MPSKQTLLSWLTHTLTASSAVLGLWAMYFAIMHQLSYSFFLLMATMTIDSIDGPIARKINVKKYTSDFDGALLDNIVDFFTWSIVPCFILIVAPIFTMPITIALTTGITFASCYQFCCLDAKCGGQYFKRFPSYWSPAIIVAYLLVCPTLLKAILLFVCIICSFVPLYVPKPFTHPLMHQNPIYNKILNYMNNITSVVIGLVGVTCIYLFPAQDGLLGLILTFSIIALFLLWFITTYTVHQQPK